MIAASCLAALLRFLIEFANLFALSLALKLFSAFSVLLRTETAAARAARE